MGKKDYQLFAETISEIKDETKREELINFLKPIFQRDNYRFSENRFREWIRRRLNNESMKGTRYNPKYMLKEA